MMTNPSANWNCGLIILVLALLCSSCVATTVPTPSPYPLTIQDAPIVVGEQPANDANAIVGTWSTNNLLLTATGDISGRINLTMNRPVSYSAYQDVLMVQVWATYVWPQHGDTITQPAGDFIPVVASASSDTSVVFDLDDTFEIPALALDIDGGMPLLMLNVTMVWFRVTDRDEGSYGWYGAKVGTAPQVSNAVWGRPAMLSHEHFRAFAEKCQRLRTALGVPKLGFFGGVKIGGALGYGKPTFSAETICFNGRPPGETLLIHRVFHRQDRETGDDGLYWDFVKTNQAPYDRLVVAVLLSFKYFFPEVALFSDGGQDHWAAGMALYTQTTGRSVPDFASLATPQGEGSSHERK